MLELDELKTSILIIIDYGGYVPIQQTNTHDGSMVLFFYANIKGVY